MAAWSDRELVFPIGHALGTFYQDSGSPERCYRVVVGDDVHRLTRVEYGIWLSAHGDPEDVQDEMWTRERVYAWAEIAEGSEPETVVDTLLAAGLLAETPVSGAGARQFAQHYRAYPAMNGFGNPSIYDFKIGIDEPVLDVRSIVFDFWDRAYLYHDLWAACVAITKYSVYSGGASDVEHTLKLILFELHDLLSHHAIYFDVAN